MTAMSKSQFDAAVAGAVDQAHAESEGANVAPDSGTGHKPAPRAATSDVAPDLSTKSKKYGAYRETLHNALDGVDAANGQPDAGWPKVTQFGGSEADAEQYLNAFVDWIKNHGDCGCWDATHFSEPDVLKKMLEMDTSNMHDAWKAWHNEKFAGPDGHVFKTAYEVRRKTNAPEPPVGSTARHTRDFHRNLDAALARFDNNKGS